MNKKLKDVGPVVQIQKIIQTVVESLVDDPKSVKITAKTGETEQSRTILINIRTANGDAGQVIGKRGRTINSLRNIMYAVAAKLRKRVIIEID